jgi:hypothetical protein
MSKKSKDTVYIVVDKLNLKENKTDKQFLE